MVPTQKPMSDSKTSSEHPPEFWAGLARAFVGALLFSIPLLMTMEMWQLGSTIPRFRLVLFLAVTFLLVLGLAHTIGFRQALTPKEVFYDAGVGCAVGFVTAAIFLPLLGAVNLSMSLDEIVGKLSLEATAGSIGALLARSQLGEHHSNDTGQKKHIYQQEMFLMVVGALFLNYNVAPTEEIVLIALQVTPWHALALMVLSLLIMHVMVYAVDFRGQEAPPEDATFGDVFLRYTVVGYILVLLVSLFLLWIFGRLDQTALTPTLMMMVVLGLPGAIGGAAARLIL